MEEKTQQEETSLTGLKDQILKYFTDECGFEVLYFKRGFVMFYVVEDVFVVQELYIDPEQRAIASYQYAWKKIKTYCEENKLAHVGGVVSLSKENAMGLIMTHIRFGSQIINAQNNMIEFQRRV